tara:strand:+ start:830 stop:2197 length:1368 start_codon:yes stop_codon:yes gene_type:complete
MATQTRTTYQALVASSITDAGLNTAAEVRTLLDNLSDSAKLAEDLDTLAKLEAIIGESLATSAQGALADSATQPGDLAAVATSGDYDDLINTPAASGAFAVDAQTQITASTPILLDEATGNETALTLSYTANKAAGLANGLVIDMTDTASDVSSLLMDLQVGGVSASRVTKAGNLEVGDGSAFPSSYVRVFGNATNRYTDIKGSTTGLAIIPGGGGVSGYFGQTGELQLPAAGSLGFVSTANANSGTADTKISRDAAGILAQRNTTNAQESRIYNTYTDASNGEWLEMGFQDTSNIAVIKANANGTGTVRDLVLVGGKSGTAKPAAVAFPVSGGYSLGIYSPTDYKIQFSMASSAAGSAASASYTGLQYEMTGGVLSWGILSQDISITRVAAKNASFNGAYGGTELTADPADPAEGKHVQWQSDGTGAGDDGDIMLKITAGGVTKTITLVDFSTF